MAKKITDAQRAKILKLHDDGLSRNEIARQTGISAGSVTRICHAADRTFDRSKTKDASRAKQVDLTEARLSLAHRLNTAANDMLDMIDKPFTVYNFGGRDNTFAEAELASAPVEARRTIVTSAAIVFDKITKIVEKDTSGVSTAHSLLDALIVGLDAKASEYVTPAAPVE